MSDIVEMENSEGIRFGDQNEIIYSLNNTKASSTEKNIFLWQGKSDSKDPNLTTLIFDGEDITGSVWLHGKLFKIEPLGDGVQAFIEFDQSKALNCGHPIEVPEDSTDDKSLKKNGAIQTDPPILEVLVAYTTAAKNASGNINSLIQLALVETNQSYKNSDVDVCMNLVYTYEVSYTETGDLEDDLYNFSLSGGSHSAMDEVHTYRDQYGADVCVLLFTTVDLKCFQKCL